MGIYNFATIIHESARRFPFKTALITNEKTLSYVELRDRVNQAGNLFLGLGVKPGARVAVLFPNDFRFLEICFGLMSIGAVPIPMNAKQGIETLAYIVGDSGSQVLVYHTSFKKKVEGIDQVTNIPIKVVAADLNDSIANYSYDELLKNQSSELTIYSAKEDELCFLPYTSGSTGNPKGCKLTHQGQYWNVKATSEVKGINDTDRILIALPLYHKNAMAMMKMIFFKGSSAVILPKVDPESILHSIETYRCTFMTGVPALYRMLVNQISANEDQRYDLKSLRFVFCGSSDAPVELLDEIRQRMGIEVYEGYGLTEGGPMVTASRKGEQRHGSAGKPVPGCSVKIVNEDGIPVKLREVGELWVNNPGVTKGYWNLPEVSAKRITSDGWLKTGDAAWEDEDGFIYIVGRKDDMINIGGENAYPKEIENILLKHPNIKDVCVLPIPHDVKGQVPIAFIVSNDGQQLEFEEVRDFFISIGPAYSHPRKIFFLDALPLTGPGKVDRTQLKNTLNTYLVEGMK
ncbi:class I adenylate-forming enzyme family protein [Neobacillus sp. FSL H8-0543]|uniref:class I adenylate-forming enzyme family protein n=1 Tax=Neobacillus sp. FSL H8-0543 TaxID=2954672 RepID=UPI0031591499